MAPKPEFEYISDEAEYAESAVIVGIDRGDPEWPLAESLAELERLVNTAGAEVVARTSQKLASPNPKTFVGSGKAVEVAALASAHGADLVVFDDELSPSQQANLEKLIPNAKVIDRTALILDIFSLHALTKEGRLQVRLAQNQYLYPRLRGMWAHLASNRMGGGVGSRFGEGESQLEVDRRMVRKRITSITRELKQVSANRELQRKARNESGMFRVALAGYTNAGKSSLLNRLTGADVFAHDQLFATLDPTTRKLALPEGREVTITDTVGFIQKLPTTLVEAFKSTLAEAVGSDLILQVTDASDPQRDAQIATVSEVLEQIGAGEVVHMPVFNKIDLLDDDERAVLKSRHPGAILVSAETGEGIDGLIDAIAASAAAASTTLDVEIPFTQGSLVQFAHERGQVLTESFSERGTRMLVRIPPRLAARFEPYVVGGEPGE